MSKSIEVHCCITISSVMLCLLTYLCFFLYIFFRLANPMIVSAYGGGVPVSRRGGLGLGAVQRPVGQLMGYRPSQSQLYMSFE